MRARGTQRSTRSEVVSTPGEYLPPARATVRGLKVSYRWTGPSTWQPNWTARCKECNRLFDVPPDTYEALEVTGLLITHYRTHLREKRAEGAPS